MGSKARFESMQRSPLWDPIQHDQAPPRPVRTDPWNPQGIGTAKLCNYRSWP